ncbi:hypothetical protein ACIQRW_13315 [Streptomyces sp. NPDC091287]|uniref:hypothetical protein n=1 Tax=Streptomyces sp. NPDC091287 TaxID=3365988 RepID=UPI00381EE818
MSRPLQPLPALSGTAKLGLVIFPLIVDRIFADRSRAEIGRSILTVPAPGGTHVVMGGQDRTGSEAGYPIGVYATPAGEAHVLDPADEVPALGWLRTARPLRAAAFHPVLPLLGRVSKVPPARRRLARTLAALSGSPRYIQYRGDPPPCDRTHQTPPSPPSGRTALLSKHALALGTGSYDGGYFFEGALILLDLASGEHRDLFADDCRREVRSLQWLDAHTLRLLLAPPDDWEDRAAWSEGHHVDLTRSD